MVDLKKCRKNDRKSCLKSCLETQKSVKAACRIFHIILLAVVINMFAAFVIPCHAAEKDININGNDITKSGINWTGEELAFMEEHPVIYLGVDPGFVPFEFIDEHGEYKGIAADYLKLVSEKTGLKFEIVKGLTWPEAYEKALAGEVDVLPAVGKTSEREEHFHFSEPYYYFKRVIVTWDTDTSISGIDELNGLTVAVQKNSSHHSYLLSYPKIDLSLYDTVEAALTAVSTGTEKAFIGNLATTNYIIRTNGLTNLRLISFEAEKQQSLHFAVRKDLPELISIINKALNAITESEKLAILDKWVELDTHLDFRPIIRILAIIGVLVAIVLSVSFFWIVRLRKEIRRRKKIQSDLEKAKHEAEEANKFKSSFMARMSHEIRTPLNAIMGMSYLLKNTETTMTQSMYIERITQASNSMLSIINDILDYTKIEAGKTELEIASFSLDQIIQNVVNIILYKIDEKGLGFRLSKDPLVPSWFLGDAKRIEQILLNLLNNAVKFTSSGEVSLDVRLIAREKEKYHISFAIRDTGIGMTEEQVSKLFEPFEQGDSSINRRFGGSGLGLSIVKSFVDLMGGEVKVFSTPGEGSAFIINLSLSIDEEKESIYSKAITNKHFKNLRALILEKSGANINLIESYLSSLGMYCELTSSESSAISMLEAANGKFARPFDLFIIDYETPAEGGFKFIDKIRNNDKIVKIPKLIMIFPMMRYDLFEKINEYGIDIGIGKPLIPSILLNGILDIFHLRAVCGSKTPAEVESAPAKLDKTHHVLLAEDNKTNQLIVKSLLEQVGIDTIIANDGKEAVELYKERGSDIDLILMDLHMPGMNGYEAAEKIRELSTEVPIVAMTADVILGVREKCEQSGIRHYISKPFNPTRLIQTVKDLIMKNIPSLNPDDPVLDQLLGLKNMGGNESLYHQALQEYFNENQDIPDKLDAAIHEKRYADAAQIVHKIKSSSGSIGAKSLHDAATSFQRALKDENENEIELLHNRFSTLLKKLLEEIK